MGILRIGAVCVLLVSSSCATAIDAPLNRSLLEDDGGDAGSLGDGTSGASGVSEIGTGGSGSDADTSTRGGNGSVGSSGGSVGGAGGLGIGSAGGANGRGGGGAGGSNGPGGGGIGSGSSAGGGGGGAGGKPGSSGSGNGGVGAGGGSAGTGGSQPTIQPKSLSVGSTKNAIVHQTGTSGGISRDDACPQGQVLIGFNGTFGTDAGYLRSVSGICGTLTMGAQAPYAITTSQAGVLPVREASKSMAQTALCPANQVIVGFQGRSGSFIDALWFKCAPLSVGPGPGYALVIGATTDTALIGGQTGGSSFNGITCAANQIAVSQQPTGGSGNTLNSFGLACSTITVLK